MTRKNIIILHHTHMSNWKLTYGTKANAHTRTTASKNISYESYHAKICHSRAREHAYIMHTDYKFPETLHDVHSCNARTRSPMHAFPGIQTDARHRAPKHCIRITNRTNKTEQFIRPMRQHAFLQMKNNKSQPSSHTHIHLHARVETMPAHTSYTIGRTSGHSSTHTHTQTRLTQRTHAHAKGTHGMSSIERSRHTYKRADKKVQANDRMLQANIPRPANVDHHTYIT